MENAVLAPTGLPSGLPDWPGLSGNRQGGPNGGRPGGPCEPRRNHPRPSRFTAQIEAKLAALKDARPNSEEQQQEIADHEDLKAKVEAVLDATVKFLTDRAAEGTLEKNAKWFAATLRNTWEKHHLHYADTGFFLSAAAVCHYLIGVDAKFGLGSFAAPWSVPKWSSTR